ncbi:hypothetical protein [Pseudomonas phage vB_PsaM_M1]|nr:hypothetical protein [Pseudomonas phage vB_PsaM_M1]
MKIERAATQFQPVVITLEGQAELDCLLVCLNMTDDTFNDNASSLLEDEIIELHRVKEARKLFGILYNQIEQFR